MKRAVDKGTKISFAGKQTNKLQRGTLAIAQQMASPKVEKRKKK